jgi:hypothetical protein
LGDLIKKRKNSKINENIKNSEKDLKINLQNAEEYKLRNSKKDIIELNDGNNVDGSSKMKDQKIETNQILKGLSKSYNLTKNSLKDFELKKNLQKMKEERLGKKDISEILNQYSKRTSDLANSKKNSLSKKGIHVFNSQNLNTEVAKKTNNSHTRRFHKFFKGRNNIKTPRRSYSSRKTGYGANGSINKSQGSMNGANGQVSIGRGSGSNFFNANSRGYNLKNKNGGNIIINGGNGQGMRGGNGVMGMRIGGSMHRRGGGGSMHGRGGGGSMHGRGNMKIKFSSKIGRGFYNMNQFINQLSYLKFVTNTNFDGLMSAQRLKIKFKILRILKNMKKRQSSNLYEYQKNKWLKLDGSYYFPFWLLIKLGVNQIDKIKLKNYILSYYLQPAYF